MRYVTPGRHRTVEGFREHLRSLDPAMDCDLEVRGADGPLGSPIEVLGRRVGNRFAVQPMEGWDGTKDGLPSALTLRRWRRFGRSGAKLVWGGEAFAVREDGRANDRQLYLNPAADVARGLAALRQEILDGHRETGQGTDDLLIGLQLTHSGRFAHPHGPEAEPRIAFRHPVLDRGPDLARSRVLTDLELEAIGEGFVAAASLAWRTGFDFVDVKCCHGYLLHELLAARSREGPYGGSFENRARLVRRIIEAIRASCPGLGVAVRVSIGDVFSFSANEETGVGEPAGFEAFLPYGHGFGVDPDDPRRIDLREPFRFLELLEVLGIRLVNITLGTPYTSPHLQRPAACPPSDGYLPPEDPLAGVLHHLRAVRRSKEAFPRLTLVGSGYSYLQEYLPHVAQHELRLGHTDFVGMGRMMLTYPELARDFLAGKGLDRRRLCRTFSDCTSAPRNGLVSGCYPLDPYYRGLPEARVLAGIKKRLAARGR